MKFEAQEMVNNMRALAAKMHARDTKPRKVTGAPYISHPAEVVDMLKSWGYDEDTLEDAVVLAIAWGHDLIEDTQVSEADLALAAIPCVSAVVDGIHHLSFQPPEDVGKAEKNKLKAKYISKIASEEPIERVVVKMADRLCNTINFCEVADSWAAEYLELGKELFDRIGETKYPARVRATYSDVRDRAENVVRVDFPKNLTASMFRNFQTTKHGCTHPRAGKIAGTKFIAKCGSWSRLSSDKHVHNEIVADNFLRAAGLKVPASREYSVDFNDGVGSQLVRLAEFKVDARPIMEVWREADAELKACIREQVISAYPAQAFIAGFDTFTLDNVLVNPDGELIFVDNGCSFEYRACGKKKGRFWDRLHVDDAEYGFLSLRYHENQVCLQQILGDVSDDILWMAASRYNFEKLVAKLPESYQRIELVRYAADLYAAAREHLIDLATVLGTPPAAYLQEIFLDECNVAGTSHIEDIEAKTADLKEDSVLLLLRDPGNKYDESAIAVITGNGERIGWLPKEVNTALARLMDVGKLLYAKVVSKDMKGKWLDLGVKVFMRND